MSDLYRLIYTSRDLIGSGSAERGREIEGILAASRRNNGRAGITGALLSGGGTFVQILEGPRAAVEATFERIQCDARHGDIDVLQCAPAAGRIFTDWEMALVGAAEGARASDAATRRTSPHFAGFDAGELCASVLALVRAQENGDAPGLSRGFDAGRLRAELETLLAAGRPRTSLGGAARAPAAAAKVATPEVAVPDAGDAVLRTALDAERERTTALRRELDDARVAAARAEAEAETLARHRDLWSDRSVQLRSSLKGARDALAAAEAERDALGLRVDEHGAELDELRAHRDIWAERARALAWALCRDPGEPQHDGEARTAPAAPARERLLRSVNT